MNKLKLFLENFLVYGLSGIISKAIPLVMVPIITRMMPDSSYFGVNDMAGTMRSFASSLCMLGLYDAMFRMFFDRDEEDFQRDLCSTALNFNIISAAVIALVMCLFKEQLAVWFFKDRELSYLVYISAMTAFVSGTSNIVSAPTRMQNKRKVYLVMNMVIPVLSYSVAIPLLLSGQYMLALPVAALVSGIINELAFWMLNRSWFRLGYINKSYLKQLLHLGLPLMPNFLIYWLFNSADKLMITGFLDTAATGIYGVGSKLGQASQLIYTAFAGGWQYFAFTTMKEEDQVKNNSRIYEYLGLISFGCGMFCCAGSYLIYKILFVGEYVEGFIIAPYLFMAPLLQMLFQISGNQFLVIKKTGPNAVFLTIGALVNIILNLKLIPKLGIEGAAIATVLGYAVAAVIQMAVLCRLKLMTMSVRFGGSIVLTIAYFVCWRLFFPRNLLVGLMAATAAVAMLLCLYRKDIQKLLENMKK